MEGGGVGWGTLTFSLSWMIHAKAVHSEHNPETQAEKRKGEGQGEGGALHLNFHITEMGTGPVAPAPSKSWGRDGGGHPKKGSET